MDGGGWYNTTSNYSNFKNKIKLNLRELKEHVQVNSLISSVSHTDNTIYLVL